MSAPRFFGVDGEMSSNNIEDGHRLIQIGVAVDTDPDGERLPQPEVFTSLVGWPIPALPWDERAEQVHGVSRATVLKAPRAAEVDLRLADWLISHGANPDRRADTVMVGFNVGAFDAPFIKQALPRSFSLFSRRYADLNPLCFALASAVRLSGRPSSFDAWKRAITRAGRDLVASTGRQEPEHDAGTDALLALGAWRHIESTLVDLDEDARHLRRVERERRTAARDSPAAPVPGMRAQELVAGAIGLFGDLQDEMSTRFEQDWAAWVAEHPGVQAERTIEFGPEAWEGSVDGRTFYFRERFGLWDLELDGQRIARGVEDDLGDRGVDHLAFIVQTVRLHALRERCAHVGAARFCPACGAETF